MAWSGFSQGTIGELLSKWEQAGVFSYLLPFLILFAIIFSILSSLRVFKDNKAVNTIIALAVALISLQFNIVPDFFSKIFPSLGVGLAILLVIVILIGLFAKDEDKAVRIVLIIVGAIIALVVIINAGNAVGYDVGPWIRENWTNTLIIVGVIALVFWIIASSGRRSAGEKYELRKG